MITKQSKLKRPFVVYRDGPKWGKAFVACGETETAISRRFVEIVKWAEQYDPEAVISKLYVRNFRRGDFDTLKKIDLSR